jgi:2,3-bisphosphoglycerate-independent phosphoglycerate mutase
MYSSGGVHSFSEHFHAMLRLAKQKNVKQVYLHLVSDGRDMPEQYFCTDFALLEKEIDEQKLGVVASLVGRYFAMDRDKQYADRTKVSYDLMIDGQGEEIENLQDAVKRWYVEAPELEDTDYYIRPVKTKEFEAIKEESIVIMLDFRSDRMIQIVEALEQEDFREFPRKVRVKDVTCIGPYSDHLPIAFPPATVHNNLGSIIANAGLKQLRITETDKFAHVTFFFNSQHHKPYKGETRMMIESPKVSNYAVTPEMSSAELTKKAMIEIKKQEHDFIVLNYPNPDLVGHGGQLDSAVIACETIDKKLTELLPALESSGYDYIITSDHGNAECMLLDDGETANPSHTTSQIQTFVKSDVITQSDLEPLTGLKDIAPLCLNILGLDIPSEMQ